MWRRRAYTQNRKFCLKPNYAIKFLSSLFSVAQKKVSIVWLKQLWQVVLHYGEWKFVNEKFMNGETKMKLWKFHCGKYEAEEESKKNVEKVKQSEQSATLIWTFPSKCKRRKINYKLKSAELRFTLHNFIQAKRVEALKSFLMKQVKIKICQTAFFSYSQINLLSVVQMKFNWVLNIFINAINVI